MTYVLFGMGLGLATYSMACIAKNINFIKLMLFSIIAFWWSHIIASSLLLILDKYTVDRTLLCCALFYGVISIYFFVKKTKICLEYDVKEYIIPIIISMIMLPFVCNEPFEYFGMGQDEGVYQTQAILYINDVTAQQYDIEEYYLTEVEVIKEEIETATSADGLLGLYKYKGNNLNSFLGIEEDAISERAAVFHGIPTFSAVLALWGTLFGIENMTYINAVFYICCIFLLNEICIRLGMNKVGRFVTIFTYAWCPLVIWVGKSALTETGLTLIWLIFIYGILNNTKRDIYLSVASIICFSVWHISVYVFMPFFVVLYLILYFCTGNKTYVKAMVISTIGYLVGFLACCKMSYVYTITNYNRVFWGGINSSNIIYVVILVCVGVTVAGCILCYLAPLKKCNIERCKKGLVYLIRVFIGGAIIYWGYNFVVNHLSFYDLPNLSIIAFVIIGGVSIPLVVYVNILFKTYDWLNSRKKAILLGLFLYCIVFYSILSPEVKYFYYYARYLAMYIPIIALIGGSIIQKIWQAIIVIIFSVSLLMPYNYCLIRGKDDSRIEWETLLDISHELEAGDILFLDSSMYYAYYLSLKAMSDVDIFPMNNEVYEYRYELNKNDGEMYYFTYYMMLEEDENMDLVIRLKNIDSQDHQEDKENVLQLPMKFEQYNMIMSLYKLN